MKTFKDKIIKIELYGENLENFKFKKIKSKLLKVGFKKIKLVKNLSKHKYSNLRQIFNSVYMKKNTLLSHVLYEKDSSHINIHCTK